jgi:hypothetical protein
VPAVLATATSVAYGSHALASASAGILWTFSVAWAGVGCYINGRSCGRVHCKIDGILLPALSVAGALNVLAVVSFSWSAFWGVFLLILFASFLPELFWKRYSEQTKRRRAQEFMLG